MQLQAAKEVQVWEGSRRKAGALRATVAAPCRRPPCARLPLTARLLITPPALCSHRLVLAAGILCVAGRLAGGHKVPAV